jgi:hypothetical protein
MLNEVTFLVESLSPSVDGGGLDDGYLEAGGEGSPLSQSRGVCEGRW